LRAASHKVEVLGLDFPYFTILPSFKTMISISLLGTNEIILFVSEKALGP